MLINSNMENIEKEEKQYILKDLQISGLHFISNFISLEEEKHLISEIDKKEWNCDIKRRVQHYGYKYDYKLKTSGDSLKTDPIPEFFNFIIDRLVNEKILSESPDQLIINGNSFKKLIF